MALHASRFRRWWPAVLLLFFCPSAAHAHTAVKGMGDFVSGMAHPFTAPAHILLLLGLALLLGQHSPLNLKPPMLVFLPLSAAALLLTTTGFIAGVPQSILAVLALVAAALVAVGKPIPLNASRALFAASAIAIGLDSGVDTGITLKIVKTLFGTWVCLLLVVCDVAFYVSLFNQKQWQKIGIRVAGSWIIAISLMVLAFALKK